jgi:hypothetical protein
VIARVKAGEFDDDIDLSMTAVGRQELRRALFRRR